MPTAHEYNFDALVGPTHHYAGLSRGNLASMRNAAQVSSPRKAALEGLAKMRIVMGLGVGQAVLPPHERPHLPTLRRLGFTGDDAAILRSAQQQQPRILSACSSASAMWAANAATVSPSADCADGRLHFTPANLITQFHRSIEPPTTTRIFRAIFADESRFAVHDPLPASPLFADEGAANHMRLLAGHAEPGTEVFVYGRRWWDGSGEGPKKFPARQTYEASSAIAQLHLLDPQRVIFLQQNPAVIDAGAFHNDVVAVANQQLLLHQEYAFAGETVPFAPGVRHVAGQIPIADAVGSYLFNSQLITLQNGSIALIAPIECRSFASVQLYIEQLLADGAISRVEYVDVRQSMQNGGGPACLRLRVVMTDQEVRAIRGRVILNEALANDLEAWINRHYRDELTLDDLADPKLLRESLDALDALSGLLELGSIYEFQLGGR